MNVKYEIVQSAYLPDLIDLYKDAGWWVEENDGVDPEFITKIIRGSFCFAIALVENRIIGMGRALSDGVSDAYIQDVVVLSQFRGKGIGRQIINTIINHLQEKGISWIGLISEPDATAFYQSLNFEIMENYTPFKYKGEK